MALPDTAGRRVGRRRRPTFSQPYHREAPVDRKVAESQKLGEIPLILGCILPS